MGDVTHQLNSALAMTLRFATLRPVTVDTDRLTYSRSFRTNLVNWLTLLCDSAIEPRISLMIELLAIPQDECDIDTNRCKHHCARVSWNGMHAKFVTH
jgi:hypothetical protein